LELCTAVSRDLAHIPEPGPESGPGFLHFQGTFVDRLRVGWLNGFWQGTTRAEDAQGTPTQSHISPSILVYEDKTIKLFPPRSAAVDPRALFGDVKPRLIDRWGHCRAIRAQIRQSRPDYGLGFQVHLRILVYLVAYDFG